MEKLCGENQRPQEMAVLRGGRHVGAMKIDHSIDGGVFSLDDYVLIIFGLPFAMDRRFPQVSYPSIYLIGRGVRAVGEGFMGGRSI